MYRPADGTQSKIKGSHCSLRARFYHLQKSTGFFLRCICKGAIDALTKKTGHLLGS